MKWTSFLKFHKYRQERYLKDAPSGISTFIKMGRIEEGLLDGWHQVEYFHDAYHGVRWTSAKASCLLKNDPQERNSVLQLFAYNPLFDQPDRKITVRVNGKPAGSSSVDSSLVRRFYPIETRKKTIRVDIEVHNPFTKKTTGDPRELGIAVFEISALGRKASHDPRIIELETTHRCNINPPCVMCYPRILASEQELAGELHDNILNQVRPFLKKADAVSLHGRGDPLAYSRIEEIINSIDTGKTRLYFCTNGLLLYDSLIRAMIRKKIEILNVSVDAATADTYAKLRKNRLNVLIRKLKRVQKIKKEMKAQRPRLSLSFILMKENAHEAADFIDLAQDVGAYMVRFSRLNPLPRHHKNIIQDYGDFLFDYNSQIIPDTPKNFQAYLASAVEKARTAGIEITLPSEELDL